MPVVCDVITIQFDEKDLHKAGSGSVFFPFVIGAKGQTTQWLSPSIQEGCTMLRHFLPLV